MQSHSYIYVRRKPQKHLHLSFYARIVAKPREMDHVSLFGGLPLSEKKINHVRIMRKRRGPGLQVHLARIRKTWGYRR